MSHYTVETVTARTQNEQRSHKRITMLGKYLYALHDGVEHILSVMVVHEQKEQHEYVVNASPLRPLCLSTTDVPRSLVEGKNVLLYMIYHIITQSAVKYPVVPGLVGQDDGDKADGDPTHDGERVGAR